MEDNIRIVTPKDSEYPNILKEISSIPQRLWLRGAELKEEVRLTVVGARYPTNYGKKMTKKIVGDLARSGVTIVSGLALGIDGLAHEATLEQGGKAIAVLASGVDRITPATNAGLGRRVLSSGGTILSERPPGAAVYKNNFVARNRIQSGLSEAVLIIEAGEKSGTLITADFALDQNRIVMAVPGNADSPLSIGTNELIKQGAIPVTCAEDVLNAMGLNIKAPKVSEYTAENKNELVLLELIKKGETEADALQEKSGIEVVEFTTTLSMLEIKGIIHQSSPGKWDVV